jgi:hypothetical protein
LWRRDSSGFVRAFLRLSGSDLSLCASADGAERPQAVISLDGAAVAPAPPEAAPLAAGPRRHAIEVLARGGASARLLLAAESRDESEAWLAALAAAAEPAAWPGGTDAARRPQPLQWALWALGHAFPGSSLPLVRAAAEAAPPPPPPPAPAARAPAHESPFAARCPALRAVPPWQRKALALRKLRQCSVMFCGAPPDAGGAEREAKRNALLELVDFVDEAAAAAAGAGGGAAVARAALSDARFLDDIFAMLRCNLFRALPTAPPPAGDPDEDELPFCDPQWPQLNVAYELLLRLVRRRRDERARGARRAADPPPTSLSRNASRRRCRPTPSTSRRRSGWSTGRLLLAWLRCLRARTRASATT